MARRLFYTILGLVFAGGSVVFVKAAMGSVYNLLSRPFDGMTGSLVAYNLILGVLSITLFQALFALATNRTLAGIATRYAAGFGAFILASHIIRRVSEGIDPAHWSVAVPAIAMATPWIIAAIVSRHRLVFEWGGRRDLEKAQPAAD